MAYSQYYIKVKPKLLLIESWARNGLTDEQIAKNLGIGKTTFYKYLKEHVELSELLKKGKEVVDIQVENALLKRALGYSYTEKSVTNSDKDGEKVTVTTKEVVPDTTAQIFWLKNRRPDLWRDKQNVEVSGLDQAKDKLDDLINQIIK